MKNSAIKVAVLDDYQGAALEMADWRLLASMVDITVFNDHLAKIDDLENRLKDFQIISTMRERTPFGRDLMIRLPNLRLLTTTGMHNVAIDLDAATELGILVCGTGGPITPGAKIDMNDVVELTWGLILSLAKRIPQEDAAMRKGQWQTSVGTSLKGKTLGILGLGNLGLQVADIGRAFGMSIIAWSQNLTQETAAKNNAELKGRDEFFSQSDIISIHLKLSHRTRGLVGRRELGLMKSTALLINTSRGPIVDENALIEALQKRSIGGAGLDVFDEEPLRAAHPFLTLENVVLTPHIGYVSENTYHAFFRDTVADILAYLENKPVRVMNPAVRWNPVMG
jgi:phosphoglycerate dehydrogenase-like enzyme